MKKSKTIKSVTLASCIVLNGCGGYFSTQKPFNAGLPDQLFVADFTSKKDYNYRIAIIFDWKKPFILSSSDAQEKIIGSAHDHGVVLPLTVEVLKDGSTIYFQRINSTGAYSLSGFCYNIYKQENDPFPSFWEDFLGSPPCESLPGRKRIFGPTRTVKVLTLAPGNYRVKVKTIKSTEEFIGMDSYIDISPYDPKI